MKQLFFVLLFVSASVFSYAQLDAIKPAPKTAKKTTPPKKVNPVKPVNPVNPVKPQNNSCYIVVFRGGQFAASLNNYSIYIDGRMVCKLSNDRFFRYPVSPGKHEIIARKAGVDIMKKETYTSVVAQAGRDNYISCNIKASLLKQRLEMSEVVESSGKQSINNMKEDNCQSDIGH